MRIRSNFSDTKFIYIYDLRFQLIIKNINNNNNNRDLAVDISWGGSSCPMFPSKTQISKLVLVEAGKLEEPEQNLQKRDNKKLQTQPTSAGMKRRP